jgi:hypothetical protein
MIPNSHMMIIFNNPIIKIMLLILNRKSKETVLPRISKFKTQQIIDLEWFTFL